ncbi:hypothetical protein [Pseudoalteromonas pernae]|uniref:hypothetical protein n=1 Tax=Pseudoalteromonas pernae TaxID=3118054 RepID=UPI003242A344
MTSQALNQYDLNISRPQQLPPNTLISNGDKPKDATKVELLSHWQTFWASSFYLANSASYPKIYSNNDDVPAARTF